MAIILAISLEYKQISLTRFLMLADFGYLGSEIEDNFTPMVIHGVKKG